MKKQVPSRKSTALPGVARGAWRLRLLLAGVVLAAYINSLGLGLAMDSILLLRDPRVQAVTTENLGAIFTGPYWWNNPYAGLYRPVTTLSLLLNHVTSGGGDSAAGFHFVNLLLHLLNAFLVYALARRIFSRPWTAWFAAALWAVHPLGTEAVANVAGRADLLAAAACLGGLLWYVRRSQEASARPAVTALALFGIALLGVFSKEVAAVLPGLMLLWDISFGPGLRRWSSRLPSYAAALAAIAVLFAARLSQARMMIPMLDNPEVAAGFLGARLTALKVIVQYLALFVFPWRLSCDYSYNQIPVSGAGDAAAWLAAGSIAILLALAILRRRSDPILFFAAGWFGLALLPVSNLVFPIGSIMGERFLYLPAAGLAIAAAALGERFALRRAGRAAALAAVAVLGIAVLRTAARNADWTDEVTLWKANIESAPGSYKSHKGLATALYERDPVRNLDQSTRLLETSYAIVRAAPPEERPENVITDLGTCYRLLGERAGGNATEAGRWYLKGRDLLLEAREVDRRWDRIISADLKARGEVPKRVGMREIYLNLGKVNLDLGNTDAALEAVRYGRLLEPHKPDFYVSLAAVHMARKEPDAAAIALLEQWLADASSAQTTAQLRSLYVQFPDGGCAFTGGEMNVDCPRLRRDLCTAAAGVVKLLGEARRSAEAETAAAVFRQRYGCAVQ